MNNNYNSNTVVKQDFAVVKQVDCRVCQHMTDTTRHQSWQNPPPLPDHAGSIPDGQVNVLSCLPDWANLPYHKKLGIFKFMFSLSDVNFFIVHVLDSNFVFRGPKLDL